MPSGRFHVSGVSNFSGSVFVNSIPVSVSGHTHTASNITNFNSSVSGLLPVTNITGGTNISVVPSGTNFTVSASGLQPSGNYANSIHSHVIGDITGLQTTLDSKASTSHTHDDRYYTESEVDNLLSLKQSSGNYSIVGHSHTSSDIINFNTSVSGLINGIYAPLNSPTLTGVPLAPTASTGTNTNQIASTQFVRTEISNLVNAAPSALDTLNELAAALGNDANFSTTVTNGLAQKANISGTNFTGTVTAPTGNFTVLQQNGVVVSVNGHTHTVSSITDFNSSVNSLLPTIANSGDNRILTSTGSTVGINAESGATFDGTNFNVTGVFNIDNLRFDTNTLSSTNTNGSIIISPNGTGNVGIRTSTPSGALHVVGSGLFSTASNNIAPNALLHAYSATSGDTIFNVEGTNGSLFSVIDSLSGSLMSVNNNAGLPIFEVFSDDSIVAGRFNQNDFVVTSGGNIGIGTATATNKLQVSGNVEISGLLTSTSGNFNTLTVNNTAVSVSGHTHTSSNITDFGSSVSGLLPVTNIVGGTNISVTPSGTVYTINVSGSLGLTTEEVDDRISNLLIGGSGISLTYDDNLNTLTINNTSISPDEIEEYSTTSNFPASGDANILYIANNTAQMFKWDGEVYYEAGPQGADTGSHSIKHMSDNIDPIPLTEYNVPQFTSNTNNLNHLNKDVLYITADANNRELTGLLAPSFCCVKLLVNTSSTNTIIVDNQSTNSDPANRFLIYTGADYYLLPGQSLSLLYSTEAMRWRVL